MMCEECGKILKGPGSLKSHMDMHADRRPFPCPMEGCDKRFRVKNKLAIHMIIHKGEKNEQCRFCGRLFYFQKDLARHERTHTGEKPYGCPMCPKSFNVKQHLTVKIPRFCPFFWYCTDFGNLFLASHSDTYWGETLQMFSL